jgi:hypothetical protein
MRTPKSILTALVSLAVGAFAQSLPTAILTASDAATNPGELGYSVAVSGSTVAGGAPGAMDGQGGQGVVYVFSKAASAPWTDMNEAARLIYPSGGPSGEFGVSVAISGDGSVIVARALASNLLCVFLRPAEGWAGTIVPVATLIQGPAPKSWISPGQLSGVAINSKGTTIVAGAPDYSYEARRKGGEDIPASPSRCAVYVWATPANGWAAAANDGMTQTATLTPSDTMTNYLVGTSIGVSTDTIVAGAINRPGAGMVYLFQKPQKGWVDSIRFASKLTVLDGQMGNQLGTSVAVGDSGAFVAAGAVPGCPAVGVAYVFVRPPKGWPEAMTQTAELTPADGGSYCFGNDIAVAKGLVLVGAPLWRDAEGEIPPGAGYSFAEPSTGWLDMSVPVSVLGGDDSGELGYSTSIGGRSSVIGAPLTTVNGGGEAGAVYVFSR